MDKTYKYRLPWTLYDQPFIFYGVTHECDMGCEDCYSTNIPNSHKNLDVVQEQIKSLLQNFHIELVVLGGGEPLLHPEIADIVSFIKKETKLKVIISTNGKYLTEELAVKLYKSGLDGFTFHVDTLQRSRKDYYLKPESNINELRNYYLELAKKYNFKSYFTISVNRKNYVYLDQIIKWFLSNTDKNNYLVITLIKSPYLTSAEDKNSVSMEEVIEYFKSLGIDYSSYIDSNSKEFFLKWVYFVFFTYNGEIIGNADGNLMELIQLFHHFFYKTYISSFPDWIHKGAFFILLIFSLFSKYYRKILFKLLKRFFKRPFNLFDLKLNFLLIIKPSSVKKNTTPSFFSSDS